jgi:hypothetical protein
MAADAHIMSIAGAAMYSAGPNFVSRFGSRFDASMACAVAWKGSIGALAEAWNAPKSCHFRLKMAPKVAFCAEKEGFCGGFSCAADVARLFVLIDLLQEKPLKWCGSWGEGVGGAVKTGHLPDRFGRRKWGGFGSRVRDLVAQRVSNA